MHIRLILGAGAGIFEELKDIMPRTADVLSSARSWEPCIFTGADRGVGCCLTEAFLREGWKIQAGQLLPSWPWLDELKTKYPDTLTVLPLDVGSDESVRSAAEQLDMLVSNAGIPGGEDETGLRSVYNVNTLASIRLVEALLPRMEQGMKCLAFGSSETGVITIAHREGGWGYTLSKAMLNMTVDCMFCKLHPRDMPSFFYHDSSRKLNAHAVSLLADGWICNLSANQMHLFMQMQAQVLYNGTHAFSAELAVEGSEGAMLDTLLLPLAQARLIVYAEIPAYLASDFSASWSLALTADGQPLEFDLQ